MQPVIACVDVDYRTDHAAAACVLLRDWTDAKPSAELVARIDEVAEYEPGAFYKRELPCILAVLSRVSDPLACVVVDGYVWLDAHRRPGLGARLHEALGGAIPVVGIAKKPFGEATFAESVLRGTSLTPLYVTAVGLDPHVAADHLRAMHGPHRIPTLLTRVDRLCRDARV